VYAFGERWGPEADRPDKVFGFSPGNGVHDIHMNQGKHWPVPPRRWRLAGRWAAAALSGHRPVGSQLSGVPEPGLAHRRSDRAHHPGPDETVTLLNTSAHDLDLGGWALLDRLKQRMPLDPITLPAGETVRIQLQLPLQLGNQGGLLTLLNPDGLKVDGVAYTGQQADAEGRTVVPASDPPGVV